MGARADEGKVTMKLSEKCARAVHDVLTGYCDAIGDPSSPLWDDLTAEQRDGIIRGVERVLAGDTPRELHAKWMESRLAEGWTLGKVKDFSAKTSPCLVPYEQLPQDQRVKDSLFRYTVLAVVKVCGTSEVT